LPAILGPASGSSLLGVDHRAVQFPVVQRLDATAVIPPSRRRHSVRLMLGLWRLRMCRRLQQFM